MSDRDEMFSRTKLIYGEKAIIAPVHALFFAS